MLLTILFYVHCVSQWLGIKVRIGVFQLGDLGYKTTDHHCIFRTWHWIVELVDQESPEKALGPSKQL